MNEILKEIKSRIEKDENSPEAMYTEMKVILMRMYMTNTMSKDDVIKVCSDMIGLYDKLKSRK